MLSFIQFILEENQQLPGPRISQSAPDKDDHAGLITPKGTFHHLPNVVGVHYRIAKSLGYKNETDAITNGHVRYRVRAKGGGRGPELHISFNRKHPMAVRNAKSLINKYMTPDHTAYIDAPGEDDNHSGTFMSPREAHGFVNKVSNLP